MDTPFILAILTFSLASCCQMCYIEHKEGEARDTRPTPDNEQLNAFQHQPFTIGSSGRLFFSPKDRVTQSYESDNEDTYLDQIRICNVHWHPSFLSSGGLPLRRG